MTKRLEKDVARAQNNVVKEFLSSRHTRQTRDLKEAAKSVLRNLHDAVVEAVALTIKRSKPDIIPAATDDETFTYIMDRSRTSGGGEMYFYLEVTSPVAVLLTLPYSVNIDAMATVIDKEVVEYDGEEGVTLGLISRLSPRAYGAYVKKLVEYAVSSAVFSIVRLYREEIAETWSSAVSTSVDWDDEYGVNEFPTYYKILPDIHYPDDEDDEDHVVVRERDVSIVVRVSPTVEW